MKAEAPPIPARPRRWRRRLLRLVLGLALCYLVIMFLMWWFENRLVYRPFVAAECWEPAPDPLIEDVWLMMDDGTRLHAWWYPGPESRGAVMICHGNGGNLSGRGLTLLRFGQALDRSIFIFDYPGYGKSEGRPNERKCYAAAETAYRWLTDNRGLSAEQITFYGESLGGGVAVELATKHPHHSLVLMKTFTSMPAVAKRLYPWLPIYTLMSNRFDNLAKIKQCTRPVLIVSARGDTLVPYAHGEELFGAAPEPKRFIALDGDHNEVLPDDFLPQLREFLDQP